MRRLFIAINLPENIKERIGEVIERIKKEAQLPEGTRWAPAENWHLTLVFLGYQPDETISPILNSIKETLKQHSDILKNVRMLFDRIILAPPGKQPKMIWLTGAKETSKILGRLKNDLESNLIKNGARFKRENRGYNAHLTIARFRSPLINTDSGRINADIIRVNQRSNQHESALGFQVRSLDLMESRLKRTGAEYEILAKVDF